MNNSRLYSLIQSARQSSFLAGLRAEQIAHHSEVGKVRAELADALATVERLRTELDNARGELAMLRSRR